MIIRQALAQDAAELAEFNISMARETESVELIPDVIRAGVEAMIQHPERGFYLVVELDNGIQASLMVTTEWSDWRNGTFWWIQSLYVEPEWRRRGVLRSMHDYIMAETRARPDVCGVRLYVEAGNTTAQAAYERVGLSASTYRVFERDFVLTEEHSGRNAKATKGKKR